ncbi:dTDP-4-dehydrorhamnose reductase [uncultured Pseudoteredinibacter sp.]|uniref:dTDP-4-dehydrorhamnose reductase n=1 Tax=uncultured Pseudoteredinibacter sp. TaxID=1641701 RepID=UPI002635F7EE|nr:dTDP-4-dehydrorhamnose reductase [uncultured Pseudoteredinibacter sp.]
MKILITGGSGQLGYHLQKIAAIDGKHELLCPSSAVFDLANSELIESFLASNRPDVIINAAAYTAVDKAETEIDLAMAINGSAVESLANYSIEQQCPLIQVSTDFVFDGQQGIPYAPQTKCQPLGIYGESKYLGEQAALRSPYAKIVRTSWVYSEHGSNFVKTMLRLAAEREQLSVVADQVGSPSYAGNLAKFIWQLLESPGDQIILHCSDAGVCSWYDFAHSVFDLASSMGKLKNVPQLTAIRSDEYPTPAKRPSYSVLDCSESYKSVGLTPQQWREALTVMLEKLN